MESKYLLGCWLCCWMLVVVFSSAMGSSVLNDDALLQKTMDESIQDLFEEPLEEEGRFFNYDRGAAFNTSVAFTIPLFSFTLPGAAETAATGLDANSFGVLAFVALFLLGGLAVAIYTTSQGGNDQGIIASRSLENDNFYINSGLINQVYDSIAGLPEALDFESCAKLSVCEAHAQPEKYGYVAWPFRFFVPAREDEENINILTDYEKAAIYGVMKEDECYYEYPCIVQPLDIVAYLKDYLLSSD